MKYVFVFIVYVSCDLKIFLLKERINHDILNVKMRVTVPAKVFC